MIGKKNTIETAEDLLNFLEEAGLTKTRRRDLKSAVNRFCDMAGCSPRSLPLGVLSLREKSRKIRPAAPWRGLEDVAQHQMFVQCSARARRRGRGHAERCRPKEPCLVSPSRSDHRP